MIRLDSIVFTYLYAVIVFLTFEGNMFRGRPFNSWGGGRGGGGGVGDFEKKIPAKACRKKKIACSTNVIESLWEKKGKRYPAHHIARNNNNNNKFYWKLENN